MLLTITIVSTRILCLYYKMCVNIQRYAIKWSRCCCCCCCFPPMSGFHLNFILFNSSKLWITKPSVVMYLTICNTIRFEQVFRLTWFSLEWARLLGRGIFNIWIHSWYHSIMFDGTWKTDLIMHSNFNCIPNKVSVIVIEARTCWMFVMELKYFLNGIYYTCIVDLKSHLPSSYQGGMVTTPPLWFVSGRTKAQKKVTPGI